MTKLLLLTLFLRLAPVALATEAKPAPAPLQMRMADDGKTLTIHIDGYQNQREIHYHKSFEVAGMSRLRKELLILRVFHEQGIDLPVEKTLGPLLAGLGAVALGIGIIIVSYRRIRVARMPAKHGELPPVTDGAF